MESGKRTNPKLCITGFQLIEDIDMLVRVLERGKRLPKTEGSPVSELYEVKALAKMVLPQQVEWE